MQSKRAMIRELEAALKELHAEVESLRGPAARSYEMQVTLACVLARLTDGGSCILPLELRKVAFDEGWGYETMLVPGEDDKPMIVRLVKKKKSNTGTRLVFDGQVPLDGRQIGEDRRG